MEKEWDEVVEKEEQEEKTTQEIAEEEKWADYYREAKYEMI